MYAQNLQYIYSIKAKTAYIMRAHLHQKTGSKYAENAYLIGVFEWDK